MADNDDDVTEIHAGSIYRRRGLTEDQRAGRACLHCGGTEGHLPPFGRIGDHTGALHEWCLGAFRGEFRGRPGDVPPRR
jgi:hypothetical protein